MKYLAIILSLLIFTSTLDASHTAALIATTSSSSTCCHHKSDASDCDTSDNDQDTTDQQCCGSDDCHCPCCYHNVLFSKVHDMSFAKERYADEKHGYFFDYVHDYSYILFHPPTIN